MRSVINDNEHNSNSATDQRFQLSIRQCRDRKKKEKSGEVDINQRKLLIDFYEWFLKTHHWSEPFYKTDIDNYLKTVM